MRARLSILLAFIPLFIFGQEIITLPYMDSSLPVDKRVADLVSRMTLQEKADQLLYTAPAIPRLGIPEYNWWNEALHGVARSGWATVFPQSITLANSWDEDLMFEIASVISDEARAKYNDYQRRGKRGIYQGLTFWSPNINIFRDPRWGRGHETYGEDPYLTGRLGLQFVRGMQGDNPVYLKTVATAKHYAVHSGPEPLRHKFNAEVSEADLRETYLPAFRTLVVDGKVESVMGAYNMFRGEPCCASTELYDILRNEWGFDGYVVSDCWAISDFHSFQGFTENAAQSAAIAVKRGTDLNCGVSYRELKKAFDEGLITEEEIDIAVKRVMTSRFRLGMFDPPEMVPWSTLPLSVNCSDYNNSLAREAARKSIVLLKNNGILPLDRKIRSIAVIGPNADNFEALIGNYNGIPKEPVTIIDGIRNKIGETAIVTYAQGSDLAAGIHNLTPIPSVFLRTSDDRQGVEGEYYDNSELNGAPLFKRIDDNINFYWETGSPHPEMPDDDFAIRWTTWLVPPETGEYFIGSWGSCSYEIKLEGEEIISYRGDHHAFHREKPVMLEAGKKYRIELVYRNIAGDADIKLLWATPRRDILSEARSVAGSADAVILVLGLSQRLEGEEMAIKIDGFEGGDRTHLNLPLIQSELVETVAATGKPFVVVMMNGGPMSVNRIDEIADAILLAGYAGEEGGNAVADVLFGDYNPAGRLPVTWYRSVDQIPPFDDYNMKGRTYRYFEGDPLYPFGYGLSYTTFEYSGLQIPKRIMAGDDLKVIVKVTNTGMVAGDEVVQLYISDLEGSTPRPVRQLEGFRRIHLAAGESAMVEMTIEARQFSIINNEGNRVIEPGNFVVSVGGKQPGYNGSADPLSAKVLTHDLKITGTSVPVWRK